MTTVMTLDIATEIENAEIDMLSSRLETTNNKRKPNASANKKFGSATAFSSKIIAGPAFNTVKGITNADAIDAIISYYESLQILVVLKLPQHKVQLNYFNTYLKKGFINLASILLCIVYRERVHHFFLLILQYENYKKMSLIFLQTFMYVDLICHPLQKIACAKIMKFFTMNQGGIFS